MSTRDDLESLIELGAVTRHSFGQIADAIIKAGWRPPTDAVSEVEAAARALNSSGWTCCDGCHEPGEYDNCTGCRKACQKAAQAALEAGWQVQTTSEDALSDGFTGQELYLLATAISRTRQTLARNAESLPAHQETLKHHWEKKSDLCGDLARRLRLLAEESGEE